MFLDETFRNDKTINKTRGRSKRGTRCKLSVNLTRGSYKINLLLAVNYQGPIQCEIHTNSIDAETFHKFCVLKLSKIVKPYPEENSILILDNYYTHDTNAIIQWSLAMGIILLFEPAHEPNVNLTEWVFNAIKMKEKEKGILGNASVAIKSLCYSINECVGLNWKAVMNEIGYIDGKTDSDDH